MSYHPYPCLSINSSFSCAHYSIRDLAIATNSKTCYTITPETSTADVQNSFTKKTESKATFYMDKER